MEKISSFGLEDVKACRALISLTLDGQEAVAQVEWSYSIDFDHHVEITIESIYLGDKDMTDLIDNDALAEALESWCSEKLDLEAQYYSALSDQLFEASQDR